MNILGFSLREKIQEEAFKQKMLQCNVVGSLISLQHKKRKEINTWHSDAHP